MELLEQHFDLALTAPNGIQRLRELILTLAMQGKLVPQDPDDQPASELLKDIEVEKQRLVKEGKIKQSKSLPTIKPDEIPHPLPKGWEWVRIRNICHDWGQKTPDSLFTYIDVGAIDNKRGVIGDVQILDSSNAPSRARKIVRQGTVIYSTVRPYLLNIAIVDKEFSYEPIASTAFAILHPFCEISNCFIYYYLRSPRFIKYVELTMKGVAYPAINDGDFFQSLFPLPPLTEQKRIVTKIDRLMLQCDQLEKLRSDRSQKRIIVHTAALDRLLGAKENNDFNQAWNFITQHFGELYAVKENVTELRKAILQLAVMGKLVPQDPDDQPASELLKAIKTEKQKLIETGKVRKQQPLSVSASNRENFSLPTGWTSTWIDELFIVAGGIQKTPKRTPVSNYYPYLSVANVQRGRLNLDGVKHFELTEEELEKWMLEHSDLMVVEGNGSEDEIGRCAIWQGEIDKCVHQNHLIRCRPLNKELSPYVLMLLNSPVGINEMKRLAVTTSGLYNLSVSKIRGISLLLPPLAEQKRIVAKVDRLMNLCDRLEQQIDAATDKRTELLNALMAQV